MGTASFLLLGALIVLLQSPTTLAEEAPSPDKRETGEEDVPVIYFPRATEGLKRRKRAWVIPPIYVPENDTGPFPKPVAQILLSTDKDKKIQFSITGPGADQPPVGLFIIDKDTGVLYVNGPLDREVTSSYIFMANAEVDGSSSVENPKEIKVNVIDKNDNNPIFTQDTYTGEVAESSPINFEILQVKATDADPEGTPNGNVHYKIINQEPKSPADKMFAINPVTGIIRVNTQGLDREKNPNYTLDILAADMDGEGLTGVTKVILTVTDSNDNAPTFTQTQFSVEVEENKKDALVVKMLVTDEDDAYTPAWNGKFTIVDGDRDGLFSMATGINKQEGIITTAKGLDFEMISIYTLVVTVENEVPFAVALPTSTATVTVTVLDVNEAPIFNPRRPVSKPEDLGVDEVVDLYSAYDLDSKQTVRYKILSDPAGWLNVNEDTGIVTVKSEMDREHQFVKNDIYTALIGGYDDGEVPATGTGTLQIVLEDVNDNAPTIEERDIRVCNKESGTHLLTVTDKDGPGFSSPFTAMLEGSSKNNWTARMNETGTGIILQLVKELDPGFYAVELRVADTQGMDQLSMVTAKVCDCKGPNAACSRAPPPSTPIPLILGVLAGTMLLLK